ncbi:tRNA lysidine(34) synthetase TilS [Pelagibius sp.]|uniref:tRNA lysidine(34) synthetase TilS n=1 Tax=Pelagibius sp. TaxID=1931238 RepID=UPI002630920E|nr:tRNA lysidine(34) synthetase TilS [Pelagibius sp.]
MLKEVVGSAMPDIATAPVSAEEFDRAMAALGPFEPKPAVAVALSGGGDSLALTLLLKRWVQRRGGSLLAVTVDHGLRRGSAAEAGRVHAQAGRLGIAHRVLRWRGPKPEGSPQAAARDARYALLTAACRRHGILHLALAHHLEDQAETLLLRLGRGSGLEGLAGMAPLTETAELRLLRPLLAMPKARLLETVKARRQGWVEDPSNERADFARVRLRRLMPALAREGLSADRLATACGHLGRARAALEGEVAALMARAVRPDPAGFLILSPKLLATASDEVSLRTLAHCLMTVGGGRYTPRLDRLLRLHRMLGDELPRGATLGGCRVLQRGAHWLLVREAGRCPGALLEPGGRLLWDGRFEIRRPRLGGHRGDQGQPCEGAGALQVSALGTAGWQRLKAALPGDEVVRADRIPAPARAALPALSGPGGFLAVPLLGYYADQRAAKRLNFCRFAPLNGLTAAAFTVV